MLGRIFFNFTVFGLKRSGKSTLLNTFVVALSPPEVKVKNWYHARVTVKDNIEGDGTLEYSFVDISQDVPSCMIHFYDTRGFFGQWEKERRQFDQITNGKATNNTIVEEKNTRTWIEWLCRKKFRLEFDNVQTPTINTITHCIFFVIDGTKKLPIGFDVLINGASANKIPFLFVITHADENYEACLKVKQEIQDLYSSFENNPVWLKSQVFLQENYVINEKGVPHRKDEIDHSALNILKVACLKANGYILNAAQDKFTNNAEEKIDKEKKDTEDSKQCCVQ